jgi:hypothetical protein
MTDPCMTATVQIDARRDVVYGLITDLQRWTRIG